MQDKILKLIKNSNISIPRLFLSHYKSLEISDFECIMLIYLMNEKESIFDPKKIADDMNITLPEVLTTIESLSNHQLLKIELKKINQMRQEFINLDNLYNKLLYLIIQEEDEETPSNIYSIFESEFGRTLAPMEYEIINSWIDSGHTEDVIIAALKEAVYNGIFKLNYIDKILYEWQKKGVRTIKDIEQNKTKFKNTKVEKKELYDYNWLEDDG